MPNVSHIDTIPGVMYIDRPGYYFGYGLESDPDVMEAILNRPSGAPALVYELGVKAVHKQLVIQELDQVPNEPTDIWGGKSAQEILADTWRQHTTVPFSAYALRNSDNRSDVVGGTLFELFMEDAHVLNEWDLADPNIGKAAWRDWAHAIELTDGRMASTLTIGASQEVDRTVDGTGYNPFLNDRSITFKVIHDFHESR